MADKKNLRELVMSRYKLSKKFGEKYRKECKKSLEDYELESFENIATEKHQELYNKMQVPYIFSTMESGLPSIFEQMPNLIMEAGGKKDVEFTEFSDSVWRYLVRKLKLKSIVKDAAFTFMLSGLSSVTYKWVTETQKGEEEIEQPVINEIGEPVIDENGQPQTITIKKPYEIITKDLPEVSYLKYKNIHFSPDSYFVIDDESNNIPYIILEETLSKDEVEFLYDKKIDEAQMVDITEIHKDFDTSMDEADMLKKEGLDKTDLEKIKVFTYLGTLPKEYIGDDWSPYTIYKYVTCEKKTLAEVEPLERKNVLLLGNYGSPEHFWKFGEAKVLRELETDISYGRTMMADYRDKLATKVAVPQTADFDEESFKSPQEFAFVRTVGDKYPQYITPPPVPQVVLDAIQMSREDVQMTSGQLDISRGGSSSSVNTATGQKIFSQVHEKRIAKKRDTIGEFIKALAENLLILCANNWDVETFARITDIEPEMLTQSGFIEKLQQLRDNYDLIIDVESVMNNEEAESAQAIALYRELKDRTEVDQEALVKHVVKVGFKQKDPDQFLSKEHSPEQILKSIETMVNQGLMPRPMAMQLVNQLMASQQSTNPGGRPMTTGNPVDEAARATPGSDNTQIAAQGAAAYQQQGVRG